MATLYTQQIDGSNATLETTLAVQSTGKTVRILTSWHAPPDMWRSIPASGALC